MSSVKKDLFNILKSKENSKVVFNTIIKIGNGTYRFDNSYLNELPKNVIDENLENILVSGTKFKGEIDTEDKFFQIIRKFSRKVKTLKYKDVDKKTRIIRKTISWSSFILTGIIFISICAKNKDVIKDDYPETETYFETTIDYETSAYYIDDEIESLYDNSETLPISNMNHEETLEESKSNVLVSNSIDEKDTYEHQTESNNESANSSEVLIDNTEKTDDVIQNILNDFNLTEQQFNVLCAIAMAESKPNSYEDCYAVINTIYNRSICSRWADWITSEYGIDGTNIYNQAVAPNQFIVYESGLYEQYLGIKEGNMYNAIIDFLKTKEIMHNFLQFRSSSKTASDRIQFVEGGNNYFDEILDYERLDQEIKNR